MHNIDPTSLLYATVRLLQSNRDASHETMCCIASLLGFSENPAHASRCPLGLALCFTCYMAV